MSEQEENNPDELDRRLESMIGDPENPENQKSLRKRMQRGGKYEVVARMITGEFTLEKGDRRTLQKHICAEKHD